MTIWLRHTCHNYASNCSYLLVYMTAHAQFFKICQKNNSIIFFDICHMFLTFFLSWIFLLCFLFIFSSCFIFPLATIHYSIVSGLYNHSICNFNVFSCSSYPKLERNWQTVLALSAFHAILTLGKPDLTQAHLDTVCQIFPRFPQPTFWQCHWFPCHMDIYNSQLPDYQFRKQAILYHFVVSKLLIIMHDFSIKLYKCVLLYCIKLFI